MPAGAPPTKKGGPPKGALSAKGGKPMSFREQLKAGGKQPKSMY